MFFDFLNATSITAVVAQFVQVPLERLWVGISLIFGLMTSNQYFTLTFGILWGLSALLILVGHLSTAADIVFTTLKDPTKVKHPSLVDFLFPRFTQLVTLSEAERRSRMKELEDLKAAKKPELVKKPTTLPGETVIEYETLPFFYNFDVAIYYVLLSLLFGVVSCVISPPLILVLLLGKLCSYLLIAAMLKLELSARPLPELKWFPVVNTLMLLGNGFFELVIGPGGLFPITQHTNPKRQAE